MGEERIVAFRFTRPTKRHLTEQWLSMMNCGRCKRDQVDEATARRAEEAWKQLRLARCRAPAPEIMDMYVDVDPDEGH